jgi:MATE family multidrug resistance protein
MGGALRWACGSAAAFGTPAWRDWARVFDRAKLWRMAAVNVDILIRSLLLMAIFTSFLFFAADFGDVTLAANQVLIQFVYITAYAMDGFAFAAEALVGQALGARAAARLRRAAMLTSLWGVVVCAACRPSSCLGRRLHRPDDHGGGVRPRPRVYLPWMVAAPLVGCASWMFDGIFIGATRTRDMRNMMAVSFAGYVALVVCSWCPLGQPRALGGDAGVLRAQRG